MIGINHTADRIAESGVSMDSIWKKDTSRTHMAEMVEQQREVRHARV